MRPELGEWCNIVAVAYKDKPDFGTRGKAISYPYRIQWERSPFEKPQRALFIGYRYVHSGVWREEYEIGEYGSTLGKWVEFQRKTTHHVFVFILNARTNPIYVFPDDVIRGQETQS